MFRSKWIRAWGHASLRDRVVDWRKWSVLRARVVALAEVCQIAVLVEVVVENIVESGENFLGLIWEGLFKGLHCSVDCHCE